MIAEVRKRKDLRYRLLKDLYDHHFSNAGKAKPIANEIKDNEIKLAYFYMADKGYLRLEKIDHPVFGETTITSKGIDYIEENHLNINSDQITRDNRNDYDNTAKAFTEW